MGFSLTSYNIYLGEFASTVVKMSKTLGKALSGINHDDKVTFLRSFGQAVGAEGLAPDYVTQV